MKSGLEGRNNFLPLFDLVPIRYVSMKSGLEGRNNTPTPAGQRHVAPDVSMKSGLEGRNNLRKWLHGDMFKTSVSQ